MFCHLLDKPDVRSSPPSPYRVREGQTATLACTVTAANPNTNITWRWFKTDSPNNVLHNGPSHILPNIQRGRSGSYSCTASNTVGTSEEATVNVNVQCKWFHAQLWICWVIYVEHVNFCEYWNATENVEFQYLLHKFIQEDGYCHSMSYVR